MSMIHKPKYVATVSLLLVLIFALVSIPGLFAAGSRAEDVVELEFWMPGQEPTIRETMQRIIADYEAANPNVRINYTQTPWGDYFANLGAAIAGNLAPDVAGLGYGQFGMLVQDELFQPIPKDDPRFQLDEVGDFFIQAGSFGGELYALLYPENRPLVWRRDHFREAGLDPDRPPQNWEELREYARRLTVYSGNDIVRAGIEIPFLNFGTQIFKSFYAMNHPDGHFWEEGGEPIIPNAEAIETLEYLVSLFQEDRVVFATDMQDVTGTAFMQGIASMAFPQSQSLPVLVQQNPGNLGFAMPPGEVDNKVLTLGTFFSMFRSSNHPEEALDFLAYLYSPEVMWQMYEGILFIPTRDSLRERFLADQDFNAVLAQAIDNPISYLPNPAFGEANSIVAQEVEEAFFGNKTAEQAVNDMARRLREAIR